MTVTKIASACPAPTIITTLLSRANSFILGPLGYAPVSSIIDDTPVTPAFSSLALAVDLATRYGGGGCALLTGCVLSAGAGLTLNYAAGYINCDGLREIVAGTATVPNSTAIVWIWAKQDGSVVPVATSTTPPTGIPSVLLGYCTTSGGVITAVDISGVVYQRNGRPIRFTADNGMPTDTLNSSLVGFLTQTAFNLYAWDGTKHVPMGEPSVTSNPATPQNGDIWFRSDELKRYIRTGGANKSSAAYT